MLIGTIASPPAGMWRLELTGSGIYAVTGHVRASEDGPQLIAFKLAADEPSHARASVES
jgi:hypothetical protein